MAAQKPGYITPLPTFTLRRADGNGDFRLIKPDDGQLVSRGVQFGRQGRGISRGGGWPSLLIVELKIPEKITDFVIEQLNFSGERRSGAASGRDGGL